MVALTANKNKSVAALNADGTVVAWGASADTPAVADLLTDVQAIYPEAEGYLALKSDAALVCWGNPLCQRASTDIPPALQGAVTWQY